jgi:amino acid permease
MTDEISIIKGVFVFAATIIGAGILALPVAATTTGFMPMLLILLVVGVVSVFSALDIAGTYGGGMFVGILPVLMVLRSRKKLKTIKHMAWGGKWMPYIVLSIYVIGMCYGTMKILS